MRKLDPDDWSNYWAGAAITTFQGMFENNYTYEIYDFWHRHIAGDHNHVLDLACGNGALSWIANDILNKAHPKTKITGVDFSNIDPFKRLGRKRASYPCVSFIANTSIENLPVANSSVDLIVSQYGIEYSDIEKSIPEINRALMGGGKLCSIMHTTDSVLIKSERAMLMTCRSVLEEDKLHEKYLELDQLYRSTTDDKSPDLQRIKIEIHHLTYQIRRKISQFRYKPELDNYLYRMEKVFSENTPKRSKKREQAIQLAKHELNTYTNRLQDLISAALTPDDVNHLVDLLKQHNLSIVEKDPVYIKGKELCGLSLVAIKN